MGRTKSITTLQECIAGISKEVNLFIGASSGYLFIGNVERYKFDFPEIEKEADKALKKNVTELNDTITQINKYISDENKINDGTLIGKIRGELKTAKKKLTERKIVEIYKKTLGGEDDGVAIIISGSENGKYWFKHEYDEKIIDEDEEDREEVES